VKHWNGAKFDWVAPIPRVGKTQMYGDIKTNVIIVVLVSAT
jgi:hypothetical protein